MLWWEVPRVMCDAVVRGVMRDAVMRGVMRDARCDA